MTPSMTPRERLAERGLTLTEVARRMGISQPQLTRLFNGERKWTRLTARAFSMATGIPISEVMPSEREEAAV